MIYRLLLLRHAKAGWAASGTSDFERPLTTSGRTDAAALGRHMQAAGLAPQVVLCSRARRTRESWDEVAGALMAPPEPILSDALYNSDTRRYLAAIRAAPACDTLLVVGHNPMMEDLAFTLPGDDERYAMKRTGTGFPACGLAVLHFAEPLDALVPASGRLHAFLRPGTF